jgi:HK97 gp10 family phage protein
LRISGTIKGYESLKKKLGALERESKAGSIEAVQKSVFLIHKTAVESIQDNGDGTPQVRYRNGRRRTVLASRPGDPPNTDTGRLVQSIKFDFQNGGLIGRVGTNLRYGAYLEFGTSDMAARPWLAPAIRETAKEVAKIFADSIRKVLKGVTE